MKQRFVNVALCQRSAAGSRQENLAASLAMIEEAAAGRPGLDVILLPECNNYLPATLEDTLANAEPIPGPYTDAMAALAKKLRVNLIPGSILEKLDHGKVKNTVCFINRDGEILAKYAKVHLMDALGYKESDHVEAGDAFSVFDCDFGRVGMQVCYDCRFPELARSMVLDGAEILFIPSCFPGGNPLPPRTDHWDLLIDAMALQNLTWVAACNQYGKVLNEHPFGRSRVTNPWGTPVAIANEGTAIVYATLDMDYQEDVRRRVAGLSNRKPEVYRL